VGSYTIGQVADRSGFSASALRYYEGIGLLPPTARTTAGYRVYDDQTVARLAFIARAKQLGCTLQEITDLVSIWDGQTCGPVQRRFHELVTAKTRAVQSQITELTAFSAQLRSAAAHLSTEPIDGPCGVGCACVAEAPAGTTTPIALGVKPPDVPIACTLEPGPAAHQLAEWHTVIDQATARIEQADGSLRIELVRDVDLVFLTQLVAAEQRCCAFLSFVLTIDAEGVTLEVSAPPGASELVMSMFGVPA